MLGAKPLKKMKFDYKIKHHVQVQKPMGKKILLLLRSNIDLKIVLLLRSKIDLPLEEKKNLLFIASIPFCTFAYFMSIPFLLSICLAN